MDVEIHKTRIVSFPRSGHHWLVRSLWMNLPNMVYLEHYCDGRTLVNTPEAHIEKTHDFDLDIPKNQSFRYVVLSRNPLDAIRSWYKLPANNGRSRKEFMAEKSGFFICWAQKWTEDVPNCHWVTYEQMKENMALSVGRVLRHISTWDGDKPLYEPFIKGGRHDV